MLRNISTAIVFVALASPAFGAGTAYQCQVFSKSAQSDLKGTFTFDAATEDNKFITVDDVISVGCVVLRSDPAYLSCALGSTESNTSAVTVRLGTPTLALQAPVGAKTYSLSCMQQ